MSAIAAAGRARSFAVATVLARWLGVRLDSAVNRFYRLLRNSRIDYTEPACRWVHLLSEHTRGRLLVAVDWAEWPHELRMLVAAVVVGKRAVPLFAQAFEKLIRRRSQNARENTFLRVLAEAFGRARVQATILCDRGFRRASWIELLTRLGLSFVVRLMDDVMVEGKSGSRRRLDRIPLPRGRLVDLGRVRLRSDGVVAARVIGYWALGAKEPWWLATSETRPAAHVLKLYDRRMTVEQQLRDTKGKRFGLKLSWTQSETPTNSRGLRCS